MQPSISLNFLKDFCMSLKSATKYWLLGPPGNRPRNINCGLLKGLRFYIDTSCRSLRLMGLDEREIASFVRAFASTAKSAIDVGTNDGWYSLYFASVPNIQQVNAFEPDEGVRKSLQENL